MKPRVQTFLIRRPLELFHRPQMCKQTFHKRLQQLLDQLLGSSGNQDMGQLLILFLRQNKQSIKQKPDKSHRKQEEGREGGKETGFILAYSSTAHSLSWHGRSRGRSRRIGHTGHVLTLNSCLLFIQSWFQPMISTFEAALPISVNSIQTVPHRHFFCGDANAHLVGDQE